MRRPPGELPESQDPAAVVLMLELIYSRPYTAIVEWAERSGACTEADLQALGRRAMMDIARIARGEASSLHVPLRLPAPGEHRHAFFVAERAEEGFR